MQEYKNSYNIKSLNPLRGLSALRVPVRGACDGVPLLAACDGVPLLAVCDACDRVPLLEDEFTCVCFVLVVPGLLFYDI